MATFAWILWNLFYYGSIALILTVPAVLFMMGAFVVCRLFVAFFRVSMRKQGGQ